MPDKKRGVAWVRVTGTDIDKIPILAKLSGASESIFTEFFEEDERPRVKKTPNYTMVIYRTPVLKEDYIITAPIAFIATEKYLITLEKQDAFVLDTISKNFEEKRLKKVLSSSSFFLSYCLDKINGEFVRYVSHVENNAEIFNAKISNLSQKHTENIYRASVTSSFFHQALTANLEVLSELKSMKNKLFDQSIIHRFHDSYLNVLQIFDTHKIQKELLTNLFDSQSIMQSTKMNLSVKKLTSLAFLIAVPTLISGIYGMNFKYIFLADHPYGFFISILFMCGITGIFWFAFKVFDLL